MAFSKPLRTPTARKSTDLQFGHRHVVIFFAASSNPFLREHRDP